MAITSTEQTSILNLVVSMFNAAPGAANLTSIAASFEANGRSLTTLANNLAMSSAFNDQFAGLVTNEAVATKMAANFGLTTGTAYTNAVNYFTAQLAAGNSKASIMKAANDYLLSTTKDAMFNDAGLALANKTTVAYDYSVTKQLSGATIADLRAPIANVTSSAASVTAATTASTTYTLTTGVDTLSGANFSAPLLFNAATGTQIQSLQTGDTLTGTSAATDVLNVSLSAANTPTVTNVETINAVTYVTNTLTASGISGTGVTINNSVGTGLVQTISNLAAGINLGLTGTGTLTATLATEAGSSDVMNYALSGGTTGTVTGSATIEKTNFSSTGAANTITLGDLTGAATLANKTLVTGDKDLTIKMAGAASFTAKYIDASGMTGGAKLTLTQTADQAAQTTSLANMTGVSKVTELIRDTGTTTYTNYASGLTLEFQASNGTNHIATNLVATNAALTGSTDVLNLVFSGAGGSGGVGGTTNAAGVETLNILATSTNATPGTLTLTGTTTLTAGAIGKTSTINIDATSNQAVTLTGAVTADAINASTFTKALTVGATGSQMAITSGTGADSITTGDFAAVISTGAGIDTINITNISAAGTATTVNGGDGVDTINLTAAKGTNTIVFGASSTWGDTVTEFKINTVAVDVIDLSVSNGFGVLKHGTTTSGITYGEGAGTTAGNNDTIFVSLTAAATIVTAATFIAAGTFSTGTTAVGDHVVFVVNNSANSTTASAFSVFDVVAGDTNGLVTSADTVTLVGVFTGVNAGTGSATAADWDATSFSVA